jgi:hypothetical protein
MTNDSALLARHKLDIGIQTHVKLRRGWALSEIKAHKLYLGRADTFDEYLSQEDVRKDALECVDLYKFYIVKHKLHSEDIDDIHYLRLAEAKKAITKQPDKLWEWLDNCRVLSWKDLINAVRGVRGRAEMPQSQATAAKPPDPDSPPPCCVCGNKQTEQAHWPNRAGTLAHHRENGRRVYNTTMPKVSPRVSFRWGYYLLQ